MFVSRAVVEQTAASLTLSSARPMGSAGLSERASVAKLAAVAAAAFVCSSTPIVGETGINSWTAAGPDGGIVYDVEFGTDDPSVIYAAAPSGLYRTALSGSTWELVKGDFRTAPIDVAIDPVDADRVLAAAAEEVYVIDPPSSLALHLADNGVRVAMSRDGGTVYFAAGTRVFRSLDRGRSWAERAPLPGDGTQLIHFLAVDPYDGSALYAGAWSLGVFLSVDGGASWQRLGEGVPQLSTIQKLAVDPSNPERLLAVGPDGLLVSNDRGVSWNSTAFAIYALDVDVDPHHPGDIYVTGSGRVWKSTDGGATWSELPVPALGFRTEEVSLHPTVPGVIAAFGSDGFALSFDAGATWTIRDAGLKAAAAGALVAAPSSGRQYFGVTGKGVFFVEPGATAAAAVNNAPLAELAPNGVLVAASAGADDVVYAVLDEAEVLGRAAMLRSTDGGDTWSEVPIPLTDVESVAVSPLDPQTVYIGAEQLYRSLDGGASWTDIGAGLPAGVRVQEIALSATPSVLYIGTVTSDGGTSGTPATLQYGVYRSDDGGTHWTPISVGEEAVGSIAVDPRDPYVVYVGRDAADLRKSTDGGATWASLTAELDLRCCLVTDIAFDPENDAVLYAVHSSGVMRSVDSGETWQSVPQDPLRLDFLPHSVAIDAQNLDTLLVTSAGFGVQQFTIAPDLELSLDAPAELAIGTSAIYTLDVRNAGPLDATNVRITVELPANSTSSSAATSGGACSVEGTIASCAFDVVRAASTGIAISLTTTPTAAGPFRVSATIEGDQPDPATENNAAASNLTVPPPFGMVPQPDPGEASSGDGGGGSFSVIALALLVASLLLRSSPASLGIR